MATKFADEIHALTNFDGNSDDLTMTTVSYEDHTTQWLSDGAQEVVSMLPLELAEESIIFSSQANANGFNMADAIKVTAVTRSEGTAYQTCRRVPVSLSSRVSDSNDLLFATNDDPVYYIEHENSADINELYIKPDPSAASGSGHAKVYYIPEFSIDDDATTIPKFPQIAEPAVVLYAAMKALSYKMAEMHTLVPKHSDQDGTYASPTGFVDGVTGSQGWEVVRHWIEAEEDSELAGVNAQVLGAEVQQWIAEYQWYQSKYQMLQVEYQQKLAMLSGKQAAPQSPPPEKREGR